LERSRDAARRKKELARLEREASNARCIVCGEPVGVEDRCADGNYLHRACAYEASTRLNVQTSG